MYKKTIFTLLPFLDQISIIEKHKKDRSPQILNYEYHMNKNNNLHKIDNLFEANKEKNIGLKNFWEEDLLSQKRYCSFSKNFL